MKNCRMVIVALLGYWLFPVAPSFAQPAVFFDDFDGDALLPHWFFVLGNPTYNVGNSVMTVTGIDQPPVLMSAAGAGLQSNFRIDIRMGLAAGAESHGIGLYLMSGGHPFAFIGYGNNPLSGSTVGATAWYSFPNSQSISMPAPTSGIFDFAIERTGDLIDFYFDGNLFASLPGSASPGGMMFAFSGSPSEIAPLYLDYVQVVPAPSALLILASSVTLLTTRRRRRNVLIADVA